MPGRAAASCRNARRQHSTTRLTGIVEQNGPAVVNVSVIAQTPGGIRRRSSIPKMIRCSSFSAASLAPQQGEQPISAAGLRFHRQRRRVILTNAHVAADATDIVVKLTDRREFEAKVIGVIGAPTSRY